MENVQNKEVKGSGMEGHPNSCHCMVCSWKGGGWHGRHSAMRVVVAIAILFITFCFGVHVGKWGGHDRHRGDWGHGRGHFERQFEGYSRGQNIMYRIDDGARLSPGMMMDRQVIMKSAGSPMLATGTVMIKQQ